MITTEALYLVIVIQIFFFVDYAFSLGFKSFASLILIVALISLVFTSFVMTIYLFIKGEENLKRDEEEAKQKRIP